MSNPEYSGAYASPTASLPPTAVKVSSALAVSALVVGIIAFLSGLAPFWGLIAGGAAIALGAFALVKKQIKAMAIAGLMLGALAFLASIVTTALLVAGLSNLGEAQLTSSSPSTANGTSATPSESESESESDNPLEETSHDELVESVSQSNARRSAESYLSSQSFSRKGLIGQLEYEGFSKKDSIYGVDAVEVDWNEQAALTAQSYLDSSTFSRKSLIDQLKYEGFTTGEAKFGVNSVGL